MKKIYFITIALISFILSLDSFAGMYKCIDKKGATTYQARPCKNDTKASTLKYTGSKNTKNSQCELNCEGKYRICYGSLSGGVFNSDGGMKLCKQEKKACYVSCTDPDEGKYLKKIADINRSSYNSDKALKRKLQRIDNNYKRKVRKIDRQHCQQYKNRVSSLKKEWETKRTRGYTQSEQNYHNKQLREAKQNVKTECK